MQVSFVEETEYEAALEGVYNLNLERRERFVRKYSWAIPTYEALDLIQAKAQQPILEVGAGNGYWAYELTRLGVQVHPTDIGEDLWRLAQMWFGVEKIGALDAVKKYPESPTLMFVWPTYNDPWSAVALKSFQGSHVIYVGEGYGGCTANDRFHKILEEKWNLLETCYIPQWETLHDMLFLYRRRA